MGGNVPSLNVRHQYSHILRGLVGRHHKFLDQNAFQIDEKIVEERARLSKDIETFEKYMIAQSWEESMSLKDEKQHLKIFVFLKFFFTEKT